MTDPDDPFSDLGDSIDDLEDDQEENETREPNTGDNSGHESQTTTDQQQSTAAVTETTTNQGSNPSTETQDWKRRPGFRYDAATQQAIYPHSETWDEYEDWQQYELGLELERERDHEDVAKREYHDAVLKVAMNHLDEVVELVEQRRQE
jgi:hypothetical protein